MDSFRDDDTTNAADVVILLVRHGESEGNVSRRLQQPEEILSPLGLEQAAALGASLRVDSDNCQYDIIATLASDHLRALQTAEILLASFSDRDIPLREEILLGERSFGNLRGRSYEDVAEEFGNLFAADFHPPGGETLADFRSRIQKAWEVIVEIAAQMERVPGRGPPALLVVTHGLFLQVLAKRILQVRDVPTMQNTALTELRLRSIGTANQRIEVRRLGDRKHLAFMANPETRL